MADFGWWQLASAAVSGGIVVKVLDVGYQEVRRRLDRSHSATRFVDEHLDPLLKVADELAGKLQAMGREDFRSLRDLDDQTTPRDHGDLASLMFLFARFWAHVEIIRAEGLSVALAQDERGKRLQNFFDCLESRRVRLIDRTTQRAIGETSLMRTGEKLRTVSFIEFVAKATDDTDTQQWLQPLKATIVRGWHTGQRQKLLQYAVVLHAMIDTLDERHLVTRNRPTIPNKLSRKSWRDLNHRVFGRYLTFVKDRKKYLGPPK